MIPLQIRCKSVANPIFGREGSGVRVEGVEVRDEGLVKPAAVTVSAVAFLFITITCITTALPAMISTEIRACNHDKGNDDDG